MLHTFAVRLSHSTERILIMNATTTSSRLTQHAHPLSALRLTLLFVMLALLSSLSVPAAEPPNSTHPPSRTVSASPALRTSRTRNTLRPQSDTGWFFMGPGPNVLQKHLKIEFVFKKFHSTDYTCH